MVKAERERGRQLRDYGVDLEDRARASSVASLSSETLAWVKDPVLDVEFVLPQVDPFSGLWVTRTLFPPGCTVQRHRDGGAVTTVTILGRGAIPNSMLCAGQETSS